MAGHSTDQQFLLQALELARKGMALASPNPMVGAVIVDKAGNAAGSGFHTYDGVKHAEVLAIEAAGAKTRGGTLYINLEPCSHQGRTPPCVDAVIAAGIRRVVASMPDPNPRVSGRGFEKLRAAGIQVEIGGFQDEARRLNEAFARSIRSGRPFVTLKSAMTLNGKIASGDLRGRWITNDLSRAHVQKLRHQHDALITGIGTIHADDPLLTDRSGLPRRRPLLRAILDSNLRLPVSSRIVQELGDSANDLLVFYSSGEDAKKSQLEARGVRVEQIAPAADGRIDFGKALARLAQLQITSVMVEAGSAVNSSALASGLVDKAFLFYAPTIFSETGTVPFLSNTPAFPGGLSLKSVGFHRFADDIAIEGYLRDPYTD